MFANRSSISLMTNDDSKILGNIKPKLRKLQENYQDIQTNKLKTLNSSWTPLNNLKANNNVTFFKSMINQTIVNLQIITHFKVFEERVDLILHWVISLLKSY
jgi:hypothetical protein